MRIDVPPRRLDQLNDVQRRAFTALFDWRDRIARQEDESVHFVMPRKALITLSTQLPVSVENLMVSVSGCGRRFLHHSRAWRLSRLVPLSLLRLTRCCSLRLVQRVCHPVPSVVRAHASDVVAVIAKAVAAAAAGAGSSSAAAPASTGGGGRSAALASLAPSLSGPLVSGPGTFLPLTPVPKILLVCGPPVAVTDARCRLCAGR